MRAQKKKTRGNSLDMDCSADFPYFSSAFDNFWGRDVEENS